MRFSRIITLLIVGGLCLCSFVGFAQNSFLQGKAFGLQLATNGFGLCASSKISKPSVSNLNKLRFDVQFIKDQGEIKVQNTRLQNPKPYVVQKVNSAGTFRLSYEIGKYMSRAKPNKPHLSISAISGVNLGILKPYYVTFEDPLDDNSGLQVIQQGEKTIAFSEYIYGPAKWTEGIEETVGTYGFHVAANMNFEWNHSFYFQSWDCGIRLDYFPNGLNIIYNSNNQLHTSLYTAYSIGKK